MSYGGGTENHGKIYVFPTISVVCAFQTSPGATGKDLREWFWRARPARIFRNGKRCTQDGLTYLQIGPARPKLIRKRSPTNPFPVAPAKFGTPGGSPWVGLGRCRDWNYREGLATRRANSLRMRSVSSTLVCPAGGGPPRTD